MIQQPCYVWHLHAALEPRINALERVHPGVIQSVERAAEALARQQRVEERQFFKWAPSDPARNPGLPLHAVLLRYGVNEGQVVVRGIHFPAIGKVLDVDA